jgi:serine protease
MRINHRLARLLVVVSFCTSSLFAVTHLRPKGTSVSGEVLVKIQSGASSNDVAAIQHIAGVDHSEKIASLRSGTIWRLHSAGQSAEALTAALQKNPNIVYAEPNYLLQADDTPNDPSYSQLWGLKNTGQTISGSPGIAGADISAEAAWSVTTGSSTIVVGVVDTGIDYTHPDLAANIWSNPGGKGNVLCAAGTHGFNAITKTCDPRDDHYHGTHVSGTIVAVGNNS